MKNSIYSVFIGKESKIPEGPIFNIIEKESKRKVGNNADVVKTTKFIQVAVNNQMIKVPPKFESCSLTSATVKEEISAEQNTLAAISRVVWEYELNSSENKKRNGKSDIGIMLNFNTLSPFMALTSKDAHYVYITIDTEAFSLVSYSEGNIISTFRNPKGGMLGCLVEVKKEIPFVFYTKDNDKKGFKAHVISVKNDDDNFIRYTFTEDLEAEELKEVRNCWNKKKKTRTFRYNYNVMPRTHLTHEQTEERPNSIVCKKREDCESDEEFVKEIESSLRSAVGYIPKAVVLDADFTDMTYEEMIKLRFTYVFGTVMNEDGSTYTKTLKSN